MTTTVTVNTNIHTVLVEVQKDNLDVVESYKLEPGETRTFVAYPDHGIRVTELDHPVKGV